MKNAMNALLALATVLPLAACQKFEAQSLGKSLGLQERALGGQSDKLWILESSKCEKSGKDLTVLMNQGNKAGTVGGSLKFSQNQLEKIVTFTSIADSAHVAQTSAYTVTLSTIFSSSSSSQGIVSTSVTALDAKAFTDASGLQPLAQDQVGQKGQFAYSATATQLTVKSASNGQCESASDQIVSVYN